MNEKTLDLGDGHSVRLFLDEDDNITGFVESHDTPEGEPCGGMVEIGEDEWKILTPDPLTVHPSIVCDYCDSHGVIYAGIWVDVRHRKGVMSQEDIQAEFARQSEANEN